MIAATSTKHPPLATSVPAIVALRRAVAAEWSRLWAVRSTWWALLAALATAVFMGATFALDVEEDLPLWTVGEFTIVMALLPLMIPVLLAVTSDYATGAIRSSLQWVPRRGVLLAARTLVAAGVATLAGVATALAADMAAWLLLGTALDTGDLAASLADVAVVVGSGALLTAALATILRSTAGTLTSVFLLLLVLPAVLPELGVPWLRTVGLNLPGRSFALFESLGLEDDPGRIAAVLAAWLAITTMVGAWLFSRRDAA